uniref:Reverse transcriptase domain-containing protein n=1 Tax=Tanacetum cinerariifolium TaxID=118510 RepID=A0A6L2N5G4_TANCI|nr:hypothetical protein [Tanacetum cinerariifolium]
MDSILEDSVDECNLADPNNDLVDTIPEIFIDEHTLDYSSPPLYNDVDDDLVELESDNDDVFDYPFDSKEDKIKKFKLLINEFNPPRSSDFFPSPECDSVLYEYFSKVDALPSTNNEEKVFNSSILTNENLFEVTIRVTPNKNVNKISISNASLILEDFDPPLYELPFHKEVPWSKTLLSFSSEKEEKVFNPRILTSKGVHTSLLSELYHRGPKAFKVIKIFDSPMEIFLCSYEEGIRIFDVPYKRLAISNASLVLEDFDPPFYEPLFFKEVPKSKMLLSFSSENEEKVFKPEIHTSKKVHSFFNPELSHQGYNVFKINQIFKSLVKIFLFYCGKDTHILVVPYHHYYPLDQFKYGGIRLSSAT